jgi:hypothetical protein
MKGGDRPREPALLDGAEGREETGAERGEGGYKAEED